MSSLHVVEQTTRNTVFTVAVPQHQGIQGELYVIQNRERTKFESGENGELVEVDYSLCSPESQCTLLMAQNFHSEIGIVIHNIRSRRSGDVSAFKNR